MNHSEYFAGGMTAYGQRRTGSAGILDHHGEDIRIPGAGLSTEHQHIAQSLWRSQFTGGTEFFVQHLQEVVAFLHHGAQIFLSPGGDAAGKTGQGMGLQIGLHGFQLILREKTIGKGILSGHKVQNLRIMPVPEPGIGVCQLRAEPVFHSIGSATGRILVFRHCVKPPWCRHSCRQ